jgi:hypothetical protein
MLHSTQTWTSGRGCSVFAPMASIFSYTVRYRQRAADCDKLNDCSGCAYSNPTSYIFFSHWRLGPKLFIEVQKYNPVFTSKVVYCSLRVRHERTASVLHALPICRLSSTGKTQLALMYVENHRDMYSLIL